MASISVHQEIIEKLHRAYKIKGYVTEESVFDAIIEHDLPLDEVDYVCDHLLSMGVIIRDASIENSDDDEDDYDRSQTDYDKLFQEVVEIDKSLAPFIDEIRQICFLQVLFAESCKLKMQNVALCIFHSFAGPDFR
jgi:RNA polymerase primary sigma factor